MTAVQVSTEELPVSSDVNIKKSKKSKEEKDARKLEKRRKRELEADEADSGGLYVSYYLT